MPENLSNKAVLRSTLLANRQAILPHLRETWDAAIRAHIRAWYDAQPVPTLGVYWPIRGEPDLRPIYADLAMRGVALALPVVTDKQGPLKFIQWKPGDPMTRDTFGVAIPQAGPELHPDALLIPCVGFNAQRFRLGYGGGFYDRTLANAPRPLAIGVGYACTLVTFDTDPYDMALDVVITETAPAGAK